MVHGLLVQGHEEFFICRAAPAAGQDTGQESLAQMLGSTDTQEWHYGFQVQCESCGSCHARP